MPAKRISKPKAMTARQRAARDRIRDEYNAELRQRYAYPVRLGRDVEAQITQLVDEIAAQA